MKVASAEFARCAVAKTDYPKDGHSEIILIGKSNVGKSSLINTLINRKSLAKTSSVPGKTRTVNFYHINKEFYIVDLPGHGYARVPESERRSWRPMVEGYLKDRKSIKGALVILDPRRDPGKTEADIFSWLDSLGIPFVNVFTKADKLSNNKIASRVAAINKLTGLNASKAVIFSSSSGEGKAGVWKEIEEMLK